MIKSIWNSFKTKPMKFGIGILLISVSIAIFFVDIDLQLQHGDTKGSLSTKGAK